MTKEYIATRPATVDDVPSIVQMHRALAEQCGYPYFLHELPESRVATAIDDTSSHSHYFVADDYFLDGYGENTAEFRELGGFVHVGVAPMAWTGRRGLYIDDLYVRPELGHDYPIGTGLLARTALTAIEFAHGNPDEAFVRIDTGHNNNVPQLRFHDAFEGMNTTNLRLEGSVLKELAARATGIAPPRFALSGVPTGYDV